jgi:hypothetical protein
VSSLQGAPELRARLRAIRGIFKPIGKDWGDRVVLLAKPRIPVRTGKTRGSIRRTNSTLKKTRVGGYYPINFIDAGTKAHDVKPKNAKTLRFTVGGKAMFRKRVHIPQKAARPFKKEVGHEALREINMLERLIKLWNLEGGAAIERGGGAERL